MDLNSMNKQVGRWRSRIAYRYGAIRSLVQTQVDPFLLFEDNYFSFLVINRMVVCVCPHSP